MKFKVGKAKNGLYETQFKMMLASLDPLGLPVVVDVVSGNEGDDPLYVPSYQRAKETPKRQGILVVGDSKMSAIGIRGELVGGGDNYLTPLAWLKDEPEDTYKPAVRQYARRYSNQLLEAIDWCLQFHQLDRPQTVQDLLDFMNPLRVGEPDAPPDDG